MNVTPLKKSKLKKLPPSIPQPLILACRKSPLAIAQCQIVKNALEQHYLPERLHIEIRTFQTQADTTHQKSLSQFSTTGIFVREIQQAVLQNKADLAIHSLKDLPSTPEKGLTIRAILKRESPNDILITRTLHPMIRQLGKLTQDSPFTLPPPSSLVSAKSLSATQSTANHSAKPFIIGTASLRRQLFLKKVLPTLTFKSIRGNITTRLRKLEQGEYDGLVLAEAGLRRLDLMDKTPFLYTTLPFRAIIPAPAQGAIAVEVRSNDRKIGRVIESLHDSTTASLVTIERRIMRRAGAGCHTPLGVYAEHQGAVIRIRGMIGNIATARIKRMTLFGNTEDPRTIDLAVAKMGRHFKSFMHYHQY